MAYLDEVVVLSKRPVDVVGTAASVSEQHDIGVRLNVHKYRVYTKEHIATGGIAILGTVVGGLPGRTEFARSVATALEDAVHRLCHSGVGTQCVQMRYRHLQRQLRGDDIRWLWEGLDNAIKRGLMVHGGDETMDIDELTQQVATFPTRMGDVGVQSHGECRQGARSAMTDHADQIPYRHATGPPRRLQHP